MFMENILNKTADPEDLKLAEVRKAAERLKKLSHWLWWRRIPYALNGALRTRWRIRWHKLWEYSRGLAFGDFDKAARVLDFGGGATLPIFLLAKEGRQVLSLDIDSSLTDHTNMLARKFGWPLNGSTFDITRNEVPGDWEPFDRVISYCVIEHIPKEMQRASVKRLADLLKPGGMFQMTFDFGKDAPVEGALRSVDEVKQLIDASGLEPVENREFQDTGGRYVLDKKYPRNKFTFGSLFLKK